MRRWGRLTPICWNTKKKSEAFLTDAVVKNSLHGLRFQLYTGEIGTENVWRGERCELGSDSGGDYLMCPNFYQECVRDSLVVVLSRSGKTSEMVRALEILKKQENCTVLAMTAAQPNDFSKYADLELTMDWCYDLSVCQTRTVTNFYLALSVLFCFYRQDTCTLGR